MDLSQMVLDEAPPKEKPNQNTEIENTLKETAITKEVTIEENLNVSEIEWDGESSVKPSQESTQKEAEKNPEKEIPMEEIMNLDLNNIEFEIEGEQNEKSKK
jgi:hypothetical protein